MHADYWQQTELLDIAPRAEDTSIAFRADQERWLAPRFEERWVSQREVGTGIERRGERRRMAPRSMSTSVRRERPSS